MVDAFHTTTQFNSKVCIFNPTTSSGLAGFQRWVRPSSHSMVYMIAISGGGGGGAGGTNASHARGGGGGACSGITRFLCPAIFLPDELFIQVGQGGAGGVNGGNGTGGTISYITTSTTNVLPNIVISGTTNTPGGGQGGNNGSAGGTAPTIATTQPINTFGIWFSIVGVVGRVGGPQGDNPGQDLDPWTALPISPGAGGSSNDTTDQDGGHVTTSALLNLVDIGYYATSIGYVARGGSTLTTSGINGAAGVNRFPFFSGGAGGASFVTTQSGAGGNGGIGCGGGGGGGSLTAGLRGKGGDGGPGLVVIISW